MKLQTTKTQWASKIKYKREEKGTCIKTITTLKLWKQEKESITMDKSFFMNHSLSKCKEIC